MMFFRQRQIHTMVIYHIETGSGSRNDLLIRDSDK